MSYKLGVSGPIVLVGAGGIGAPAALALGEAGVRQLALVDEDSVELSNLHRQILFEDTDVGRPKLQVLAAALRRRFAGLEVVERQGRAVPDNVLDLIAEAALVIDATDNFPSRFLLADAAHIAGVAIVHAAAVRWQATVMAVAPRGRPCYRCLFEDIPGSVVIDCASAGVAGPVCGVSGALAADRALRATAGDDSAFGQILTYDGLRDRLRAVAVRPRPDCPLCGEGALISSIQESRYWGESCAAGRGGEV